MSTRRKVLAATILTILAVSTACEETSAPRAKTPKTEFEALVALGFPRELIRDAGDSFVIDGDMVVRKGSPLPGAVAESSPIVRNGSRIPIPSGPNRQYTQGYGAIFNRPYRISLANWNNFPAFQDAMRAAIAVWNGLSGTSVRYVEAPPGTTSDIRVGYFFDANCSDTTCVLAHAEIGTGLPGTFVEINNNTANPMWNYSLSQRTWVLVHELGHIPGFRHTDWQPNGETCGPCLQVPGTPTSNVGDANSIMNSHTGGLVFGDFSDADKIAARVRWPGVGPALTGSVASGGHPQVGWSAVRDAVSYEIYFVTKRYDEEYQMWVDDQVYAVGTTSSTTLIDASRTTTGPFPCTDSSPAYFANAVFPPGNVKTWGSGLGAVCFH